jgi:hypothetical protein
MRLFKNIEEKRGVTDPGYEPPPDDAVEVPDEPEPAEVPEVRFNPVGTGLAAVGGALVVISAFLPLAEATSALEHVAKNTLVQQGEWWVIINGVLIVLAAIGLKRRVWWVMILSLGAAYTAIRYGTDTSTRTLYPLGINGEAQPATGTVVPLAVAVYVTGAGAALSFVGGWIMWRSKETVQPARVEPTKRCPDCAEEVLAAARVCKHCGARFDVTEAGATSPPAAR